jgi:hypothetical protein
LGEKLVETKYLSVAQSTKPPVALNQKRYFAEQTNALPMLVFHGCDKLADASFCPFLLTIL